MRRLREKLAQANLKLGRNYPEPKLSYTQRGTSAGTAWLESYEIRLNPVLLLENSEAFIEEVVPHELAHLLVWKHFGRVAPHGKEWKWMMENVLGVPARRTHQFELQSVRRNTFPYRCKCQEHQLTVRRHNRVVRGEAVYRCVHCGEQGDLEVPIPKFLFSRKYRNFRALLKLCSTHGTRCIRLPTGSASAMNASRRCRAIITRMCNALARRERANLH